MVVTFIGVVITGAGETGSDVRKIEANNTAQDWDENIDRKGEASSARKRAEIFCGGW